MQGIFAYTAGIWDLIKANRHGGEIREKSPEKSVMLAQVLPLNEATVVLDYQMKDALFLTNP